MKTYHYTENRYFLFLKKYATEIALYFSLILISIEPSNITLGLATLTFGNYAHKYYQDNRYQLQTNQLQNDTVKIEQAAKDQITKINASTELQLNQVNDTITEMNKKMQALQVQKQLTGRPATANPMANINRFNKE